MWGASVLAARASRRIAEAVRTASGRVALAADAGELLPILAAVNRRDPFADPVEGEAEDRPTLVIVDDGYDDETADEPPRRPRGERPRPPTCGSPPSRPRRGAR